MAYGQSHFLTGDPSQIATWMGSTPTDALKELAGRIRAYRDEDRPLTRTVVDGWVRDCSRRSGSGKGKPEPQQPGRGSDEYKPPQVGARDHKTVRDRLQFQSRGLHIPYVRGAAYGQKVESNKWTRADLRAHDDPFRLWSGNGVVLNQDGIWTVIVKTDWSIGHPEVVVGAAQATRLMVNGQDCGLRDYLDDDAYSAQLPINTFTWTDQFRAGSRLHVDIRSEGLGTGYTAVCNVYIRAFLVRCQDGAFDMTGFPLPTEPGSPDGKKPSVPNPPLCGYSPSSPSQPARPQYPDQCGGGRHNFGFTVSEYGQVGAYKCVNNQETVVWSSYGWDGGQYFGGGSSSSKIGGSGYFSGNW